MSREGVGGVEEERGGGEEGGREEEGGEGRGNWRAVLEHTSYS